LKRALLTSALVGLCACALLLPGDPDLEQWKQQAVALRGLDFDVRPGLELRRVDAQTVLAVLSSELFANYPEDYVFAYEAGYKAVGLLPPDVDLIPVLLELQTEQIVGLYTPSDDVMYVREDLPAGAEEVGQVVVHELVHALQARHFARTMGLIRGLRHNDDVAAGIAAATEGDASFTMLGLTSEQVPLRRDLASAERMRRAMWIDLEHPTGRFARAPRLLQRSLLFPYAEGVVLAALRYRDRGNAGLDSLMRDPPLSSLQVYEPRERSRVEFVELPTRELIDSLEPGCFAGHDNVAGALGIHVLLEDHLGDADAEVIRETLRGWSGDRFLHVACPDREDFVWYTRWRTTGAAGAFASLYARAAPVIAERTGYVKPPVAKRHGRDVLVLTAGVRPASKLIRDRVEIRAYDTLDQWVADDCFTESPCPHDPPEWTAARLSASSETPRQP
jgi:hypothetical protein